MMAKARDASGNGYDGTLNNNPEWLKEGKFKTALEFDGVDDFVEIGTDEALKPQKLSVVAWFNTRKLNGYGHVFQSGKDWNDMAGIVFRVHQNGTFNVGVTQGPANNTKWLSGPSLSTSQWYHAAFTFDGANMALYLDGEQVATNTGGKILYDENPVRIGIHSESLGAPFDGFIDEVGYFNDGLTEADVKAIMERGLDELFISAVEAENKLTIVWGQLKRQP